MVGGGSVVGEVVLGSVAEVALPWGGRIAADALTWLLDPQPVRPRAAADATRTQNRARLLIPDSFGGLATDLYHKTMVFAYGVHCDAMRCRGTAVEILRSQSPSVSASRLSVSELVSRRRRWQKPQTYIRRSSPMSNAGIAYPRCRRFSASHGDWAYHPEIF